MNIVLVRKRSLYLCPGCVYDIVPYQESATLQLCRTAAAVGNTIYVRSQMTDSRQHAESTTLQPCRTPAAVGNTIHVRVACPRYAAASCSCRSLSFVTPPHHTFLFYIGTFKSSNNLDRPTSPSLHIYVHRGSFLTSIFPFIKSASLSHLGPVSLTMLLSFLHASPASQQPDRLIQGSLCYTRTSTGNHPRRSHWPT